MAHGWAHPHMLLECSMERWNAPLLLSEKVRFPEQSVRKKSCVQFRAEFRRCHMNVLQSEKVSYESRVCTRASYQQDGPASTRGPANGTLLASSRPVLGHTCVV